MKLRTAIAIVCLLCLGLAVVLGVIHDHHDEAGWCQEHQCAACQWQVGAVADVPLVFILAVISVVLALLVPDLSVAVPIIFSLASASRGPPAASI